jgi:hypothetical protein
MPTIYDIKPWGVTRCVSRNSQGGRSKLWGPWTICCHKQGSGCSWRAFANVFAKQCQLHLVLLGRGISGKSWGSFQTRSVPVSIQICSATFAMLNSRSKTWSGLGRWSFKTWWLSPSIVPQTRCINKITPSIWRLLWQPTMSAYLMGVRMQGGRGHWGWGPGGLRFRV